MKTQPPAHDAVDAITDQWAAVRPDLDTVPMAVFGRIYRLANAMRGRVDKASLLEVLDKRGAGVLSALARKDRRVLARRLERGARRTRPSATELDIPWRWASQAAADRWPSAA